MSSDGYKDTKIGRIPKEWELIKLKQCTNSFGGTTPSTIERRFWNEGNILWATPTDVTALNNKYIDSTARKITDEALKNTSLKLLNKNDILMTSRATIGLAAIATGPICTNQGFINIKCRSILHYLYLYYWIIKNRNQFTRFAQGSTFLELSKKDFKRFQIPLPPLPEQKKIAEILSTVDAAIEKTDAIIEETKQLKKGLMHTFFINKAFMLSSKASQINTNLKPVRLHDLGTIVTGATPSTNIEEYYNSKDYLFIGPADLGETKRIKRSIKYISKQGFEVARKLKKDMVMVVCIGATIGKVGITNEPCATNQQINSIIPHEQYSCDYIYYLLCGISKYLLAFACNTATPILNKSEFGKVITFIHESFSKRNKIARILSEVDAKIEKEKATKRELEELKRGLMQVLLMGQVRVNSLLARE